MALCRDAFGCMSRSDDPPISLMAALVLSSLVGRGNEKVFLLCCLDWPCCSLCRCVSCSVGTSEEGWLCGATGEKRAPVRWPARAWRHRVFRLRRKVRRSAAPPGSVLLRGAAAVYVQVAGGPCWRALELRGQCPFVCGRSSVLAVLWRWRCVAERGEQPGCGVREEAGGAALWRCVGGVILGRAELAGQMLVGRWLEVEGAGGAGGARSLSFVGPRVGAVVCSGPCWVLLSGGA